MNKPAALPRARRVTVVAPHSDDETIAAYSLMQDLLRQGTHVTVIVVTDGAASHRNSLRWPTPRLVAERRRETLRAMATLGLPRHHVRFLNRPDGGLDSLSAPERNRLARDLARGLLPDLIVMPDLQDSHPDHRDVARACMAAWPAKVRRLTYMVWHNPAAKKPSPCTRLTRPANAFRKRSVLRHYRTQTGLIQDDPNGFHLTPAQVKTMCGPFEHFVRTQKNRRT